MVQVVLRNSNELYVSSVGRFRNERLVQTILREGAHLVSEFLVESGNLPQRLSPVPFSRLGTGRPILRRRELSPIPGQSPKDENVVGAEMQDKLPDAVRTRYWMRGGLLGRHARHGLQDGGAMPSFSLQCSPELLLQSPGLATHVAPLSQSAEHSLKRRSALPAY